VQNHPFVTIICNVLVQFFEKQNTDLLSPAHADLLEYVIQSLEQAQDKELEDID